MVEFAKVFFFSEILKFFCAIKPIKEKKIVPIVRGFALVRVERGDKASLKPESFAIVTTLTFDNPSGSHHESQVKSCC